MIVLKIVLILLGAAFLVFGYLIRFRRKYHLINGFEDDLRSGRKTEKYAERVGTIEFIIGILCLLAGIILIIIA